MPKSSKPKKTWSPQQHRRFQATLRAKRAKQELLTNGAPLTENQAAIELLEAQLAVARQRVSTVTKALAILREV